MVDAVEPQTLKGLRDRALLLLGFAGAFRRSELVALDTEHLRERPEGLEVLIASSKTDQEGQGQGRGHSARGGFALLSSAGGVRLVGGGRDLERGGVSQDASW